MRRSALQDPCADERDGDRGRCLATGGFWNSCMLITSMTARGCLLCSLSPEPVGLLSILSQATAGLYISIMLTSLVSFVGLLASNLALLFILLIAAYGWGRAGMYLLGQHDQLDVAVYVFSVALGLAVLAHLMLLAGALALWYPAVAVGLLAPGILG